LKVGMGNALILQYAMYLNLNCSPAGKKNEEWQRRFLVDVRLPLFGRIFPALLLCIMCASPAKSQGIPADQVREFTDTGLAFRYNISGDELWMWGPKGAFRYHIGSGTSRERIPDTGEVYWITKSKLGDTVWIAEKKGLFRYNDGSGKSPEQIPTDVGGVECLLESKSGTTLWIGGEKGLVRLTVGSSLPPERIPIETGRVHSLVESRSSDSLWIVGSKGIFRYAVGSTAVSETVPGLTGDIEDLKLLESRSGDTLWIGRSTGLYRYRVGSGTKPESIPLETDDVFNPYPKWVSALLESRSGDVLWISTSSDLYRLKTGADSGAAEAIKIAPQGILVSPVRVETLLESESGDKLWLGTSNGLFRLSTSPGAVAELRLKLQESVVFLNSRGDDLYIGTGLSHTFSFFAIKGWLQTPWNARDKFTDDTDTDPPVGKTTTVRWSIQNYEHRTTPEMVVQRVLLYNKSGEEIEVADGGKPRRLDNGLFEVTLPPMTAGEFGLIVKAEDVLGNISTSRKLQLSVGKTLQEKIEEWSKAIAIVYGIVNVLAFLVLVIGSRWSQKCFDILADPTVRKVSIFYGFALTHVTAIRVWVFERYFEELKATFPTEVVSVGKDVDWLDFQYLPGPIHGANGFQCLTTEFETWLLEHPRVWIKGGPGTGKTEIVRALIYAYTRKASLREAWKHFGFIPIVISVRDFAAAEVTAMAQKALSSKKLAFDDSDKGFFSRLIASGGFLIIFDGLNERADDSDVIEYAGSKADIQVLITSQSAPSKGSFTEYKLPPVQRDFARELLKLFLGEKKAQQTIDSTPKLWDRVQSAYDVRLVVDLVLRGKQVPSGRLELFQATMNEATTMAGNRSMESTVCRLAWELWKKGERRFSATAGLTGEMLGLLREANVAIPRGNQFEFHHDLMRGYLAACWATREAPATAVVLNRLEEKEIWDLSASDQDAVFPFLARLCETVEELQSVFSFAQQDPEIRTRLLVAVVETANKNRWVLLLEPAQGSD
jgi:hypothetical protein